MAYNKVILQGNLTKDNELKYLPSGIAVVSNSIAVTEKYKTKDGQQKEETFFGDFSIFRGAEVFNQYTRKGSKVLIDGKLSTESWQGQDGKMNYRTKIKVESFTFLDSKQDNQTQQQIQEPPVEHQRQSIPEIDINEDEIPF
jgi:single-strand DNA-binding protein